MAQKNLGSVAVTATSAVSPTATVSHPSLSLPVVKVIPGKLSPSSNSSFHIHNVFRKS